MPSGEYNLMSDVLSLTADQTDRGVEESDSENLHNRIFFVDAMNHNYNIIAERYHCACLMSERRLIEAYDYWQEDAKRTLQNGIGEGTKSLDHFKHASFIAFWLRRTNPVNDIKGWSPVPLVERDDVSNFYQFGNEICALMVGFQLCVFYQLGPLTGNSVVAMRSRLQNILSMRLPPELLHDFATILKHKSMSPYAIYLLYRSLFQTLVAPHDPTAG
jgi:hypothetical protein